MNLINAVGWMTSPRAIAAGIFEIPPTDMEIIRKEYDYIRDGITVWLEGKFTGVLDFRAELMNGEAIDWDDPEYEEVFIELAESMRRQHDRGVERR